MCTTQCGEQSFTALDEHPTRREARVSRAIKPTTSCTFFYPRFECDLKSIMNRLHSATFRCVVCITENVFFRKVASKLREVEKCFSFRSMMVARLALEAIVCDLNLCAATFCSAQKWAWRYGSKLFKHYYMHNNTFL